MANADFEGNGGNANGERQADTHDAFQAEQTPARKFAGFAEEASEKLNLVKSLSRTASILEHKRITGIQTNPDQVIFYLEDNEGPGLPTSIPDHAKHLYENPDLEVGKMRVMTRASEILSQSLTHIAFLLMLQLSFGMSTFPGVPQATTNPQS
jgi:hypothetical protein